MTQPGCWPDAPPEGAARCPRALSSPVPITEQGLCPLSAALGLSIPPGQDPAQGPAQTRRSTEVVSE